MKTIILGNTGMLGSMLVKTWEGDFTSTNHEELNAFDYRRRLLIPKDVDFRVIVNCIGLIKPKISHPFDAIVVNAHFPHMLPEGSIQIATDCVYSGKKGNYVETDPHDALDVYGKTKSLGEAPHIKNLRCSIIGPEIKNHVSLLDWFLSQDEANGFTNHLWNGITTYHFSKIVQGIIRDGIELPNVQHIVPADKVTKAELLRLIAKAYKKDIPVTEVEANEAIDRTLSTLNPELNERIWKSAGYDTPPTIAQMIDELANL
jgi:dTDP-4-dehydrorhamnose reductase